MNKNAFHTPVKVYYHDTDAGGIVYYGRYMEFLEEGRTEFMASRGIDTGKLKKQKTFFVVARVEVDYRNPASYLDRIDVFTEVAKATASSLHFRQHVSRGAVLLIEAKVVIVCVGANLKPKRLPAHVKTALLGGTNTNS